MKTIHSITDPNTALERWIQIFISVYDKHALIKTKRVKYLSKPKWWDDELENAAKVRDQLKSTYEKKEEKQKNKTKVDNNTNLQEQQILKDLKENFKKQRNKVTSMKRQKRKQYFQNLISSSNNSKELWQAINEMSKKSNRNQNNPLTDLSCDDFNKHFTDIPNKIIQIDKSNNNELKPLISYC